MVILTTMEIYTIACQNGKYYVGRSFNALQRYAYHVRGQGAIWTRTHKPVRLLNVIQTDDPFDEDKITKKAMAKYGIDNVRGGSYTTTKLTQEQHALITKELQTAANACFKCGQTGHFSRECGSAAAPAAIPAAIPAETPAAIPAEALAAIPAETPASPAAAPAPTFEHITISIITFLVLIIVYILCNGGSV